MAIHDLKCIQPYFQPICDSDKTFELRKNDRDFKVGDELILREIDHDLKYTGMYALCDVTSILKDYIGLMPGYCIMSIICNEYGDEADNQADS